MRIALGLLALAVGAASPANVNVSRLPEPQTQPAIVVDPGNPNVLLAGSNSSLEGTMRIYSSRDRGRTWTSSVAHPPPGALLETCSSDPGVAIDRRGRQYFTFVRAVPCEVDAPQHVYVVTRANAEGAWSAPKRIAALGRARFDDKPAIAVDNSPVSRFRGRVYVAWARLQRNVSISVMLSYSDDGGRTWSRPVKVNRSGRELSYASVAIARNGMVYVAWDDVGEFSLRVARSRDGGKSFDREVRVAGFASIWIPHCGAGIIIPALPKTCVNANPVVSVDASGGRYSGRVYVSYARTEFRGRQATHVAVFTRDLRRIAPDLETNEGRPIAPAPRGRVAEQFWPQSAVDIKSGTVWACYYDTLGDPARKRAHYTCTASTNGGITWRKPVRVATEASDATQPGAAGHYGYHQGLYAAHGAAYPIWTDTRDVRDAGEEIYTARLTLADLS